MNPEKLRKAKESAIKALMPQDKPGNVVGVGIGKKVVEGTLTDCVRVYRLETNRIRPADEVQADYEGVPTDVIEIKRLGRKGLTPTPAFDPKADFTPRPGSAIRVDTDAPNVNSGATGTLGMVVSYADQRYILSCNHTLSANGRVLMDPDAKIVSAVFVGDEPPIADPDRHYVRISNGDSIGDCALARINGYTKTVSAAFPAAFIDPKPYPKDPRPQMRVKKLGAATGITHGTIVDLDIDLDVDYDFGTFRFRGQIAIQGDEDEFATAGDSGSIVVDEESKQPVAMIFAASGKYAIACRLSEVVEALRLQLANGKDGGPGLNLLVHDA